MPALRVDRWVPHAVVDPAVLDAAVSDPKPQGHAGVDWFRLVRRGAIAGLLVLAVVQLYLQARGSQYGIDFRGGTWNAGRALLSGRSPFLTPNPALLAREPNGFVTPPLLALIGAPFSTLPFGVAIVAFNLLCGAALVGALRVLGVRDRGFYVLVLCSFPFVSSLALGQPDGLFALAAAVAWRRRDSPSGAVAAGALIAAKLLAWPLIIWLLVTRRFREAAVATLAAIVMLLGSWACIGFKGLSSYPRLLSADARAFEAKGHSIVTALARAGIPLHLAVPLSVAAAVGIGVAIVIIARGGDLGWFTAALAVGLLASPVVWQHYLVLLFIPLAVTKRLRDPLVWLLALGLWLSPGETPGALWQAWLIPVLAAALALRTAALSRLLVSTSARPSRPR